jgi:hypothetical protein
MEQSHDCSSATALQDGKQPRYSFLLSAAQVSDQGHRHQGHLLRNWVSDRGLPMLCGHDVGWSEGRHEANERRGEHLAF